VSELLGTVIDGRFEVVRAIGKGGYGDVFEAIQLSVDRRVALKVVHRHLAERKDVSERFRREARLTSRLDHPNAVRVIDFGDDGGLLYLVMDLVQGPTLKNRLKEERRLGPGIACEIAAGVASALHAAHSIGLVHRDLKPSNIILVEDARGLRPVVIDFGLVKAFVDEPDAEDVTASHMMIGTPAYMSPENVLGHPVDGRSDIYALGILLYEMLTGNRPFSGSTPLETATSRLQGPAPRLPEEHPESLRDLVEDLLAIEPQNRLPSADLAVQHLKNWHRAGYTPTRLVQRDLTIAPTRGPGASGSPETLQAVNSNSPAQAPQSLQTSRDRKRLVVGALIGAVVTLAGLYAGTRPTSAAEPAPVLPLAAEVEANLNPLIELDTGVVIHTIAGDEIDSDSGFDSLEQSPPSAGSISPTTGPEPAQGTLLGPHLVIDPAPNDTEGAREATAHGRPETEPEEERSEGDNRRDEDEDEDESVEDDRNAERRVRNAEEREEAETEQEADTPGRLRVNIDPYGDIFVDGEPAGSAPQTILLLPGQYTVTTRYSGNERSQTVRIRADDTVDVTHRY
jgi:serine/threonine-protein kinase